ncbi:MAG: hypothetical protein LW834_12095 [Cyanobium sp. 49614_E6]|jgi:hypothetical protein|nr:hypothetical protein [Cyanobium sp. 49614_E6]MCE2837683.1 hypothetical protein [Cyanobium sp. 49614_E6]
MELIFGHELTLNNLTFQNHSIQAANFLPFSFSGGVINRQGDNVTANLIFPNTALTRSWVRQAIDNQWVAKVDVKLLEPSRQLYRYVGQVSSGSWDETAAVLQLNTVLDAVGGDIPFRSLTADLVGPLPTTASLYMR